MKTKSVISILLAIISICLFLSISACGKTDNAPEPPAPVNPEEPNKPEEPEEPENPENPNYQDKCKFPVIGFKSVTFSNKEDEMSLKFINPRDVATASSSAPWCKATIAGNSLIISVEKNEQTSSRKANISFLCKDGIVLSILKVEQSQENISTAIQESTSVKHCLYPYFTATWCPYSPTMDETLKGISPEWEYEILPVKIHVKHSELYTPLSEELSTLYGNDATPTGYFDNFFIVTNAGDENTSIDRFRNQLLSLAGDSNNYPTDASKISCSACFEKESSLNVKVSVKPKKAGEYRLAVWVVEDNIFASQMSGDKEIKDYLHNNVLIGSLTPINGQNIEIKNTTEKEFTFSGDISILRNRDNVRVLSILQCNEPYLNYNDNCWFVDNCFSIKPGKTLQDGGIENIYLGETIED